MIKKSLLLITLLMLCSCVDAVEKGKDNNAKGVILTSSKEEEPVETYYNVAYTFNYDYMQYDVITDTMVYNVKPENFYNIYVSEYKLIDPNGNKYHEENQIVDELLIYKTTKKLYVYRLL